MGFIVGVFKALKIVATVVKTAIAWVGTHVVAGLVIAAAAYGVSRLIPDGWAKDLLESAGAVVFGAAVGGWVAGSVGYWFGANAGAHLGKSKVVSAVVSTATFFSLAGWTWLSISDWMRHGKTPEGRGLMDWMTRRSF